MVLKGSARDHICKRMILKDIELVSDRRETVFDVCETILQCIRGFRLSLFTSSFTTIGIEKGALWYSCSTWFIFSYYYYLLYIHFVNFYFSIFFSYTINDSELANLEKSIPLILLP